MLIIHMLQLDLKPGSTVEHSARHRSNRTGYLSRTESVPKVLVSHRNSHGMRDGQLTDHSIEYQSIRQQHPTQCSPQLHANGPPGHNRAYENSENDECDDIASEFGDLDYRRPNNRGRPMMEGHTSCGSAP